MLMKMSEYKFVGGENGDEEDQVTEWEVGLPSVDDLTPLSQLLIPPKLASAFSSSLKPYRTAMEVNCASQTLNSPWGQPLDNKRVVVRNNRSKS